MIKTNPTSASALSSSLGTTNDIRGIKAPVAIPSVWPWVWAGIALACALAVAWWIWRRRRRQQRIPKPEVVIPPHEKARARLKEALGLLNQPGPFCVLVSDTIRVYLEERFRLRAPERTTEEFLEELAASALLTYDQKQTLGEFLMGCDLVKFARYEPGESELRSIYDAAVRLVDETEPPPLTQPAVPPEMSRSA
jgi:hypothetical protein